MSDEAIFMLGNTSQPVKFERLPTGRARGGSIYVLLMSTGVLKVGKARNAKARIRHHAVAAHVGRYSIERGWVSNHHISSLDAAERNIIDWASSRATERLAKEYFLGIDFDEAVAFARSLPTTNNAAKPYDVRVMDHRNHYRLDVVAETLGLGKWKDSDVEEMASDIYYSHLKRTSQPAGPNVLVQASSVFAYIVECRGVIPTPGGFNVVAIPVFLDDEYKFYGSNYETGLAALPKEAPSQSNPEVPAA